jgi:hypothetical protein
MIKRELQNISYLFDGFWNDVMVPMLVLDAVILSFVLLALLIDWSIR